MFGTTLIHIKYIQYNVHKDLIYSQSLYSKYAYTSRLVPILDYERDTDQFWTNFSIPLE